MTPPPKPDKARPTPHLDPPETVREIVKRLEGAGFETWCVGGAVRDALLGHPHLDWDLATAATPPEVKKIFKHTIPVGVDFGTIGVMDHDNVMHAVTTFPKVVQTDGRHAVVEFGVSLDDDRLPRSRSSDRVFAEQERVARSFRWTQGSGGEAHSGSRRSARPDA